MRNIITYFAQRAGFASNCGPLKDGLSNGLKYNQKRRLFGAKSGRIQRLKFYKLEYNNNNTGYICNYTPILLIITIYNIYCLDVGVPPHTPRITRIAS